MQRSGPRRPSCDKLMSDFCKFRESGHRARNVGTGHREGLEAGVMNLATAPMGKHCRHKIQPGAKAKFRDLETVSNAVWQAIPVQEDVTGFL